MSGTNRSIRSSPVPACRHADVSPGIARDLLVTGSTRVVISSRTRDVPALVAIATGLRPVTSAQLTEATPVDIWNEDLLHRRT
jgi:hypothetical protein